jgi:hypothetical protein
MTSGDSGAWRDAYEGSSLLIDHEYIDDSGVFNELYKMLWDKTATPSEKHRQ